MFRFFLGACLFFMLPLNLQAEDRIYLKNGARWVGTLVHMDQAEVVFKIADIEPAQHVARSEVLKIQTPESEDAPPVSRNEIWGLGGALGLSGGVGLQNTLRFGRFRWTLSGLPQGTWENSYYGTQVQFDVLQKRNKRLLVYVGASHEASPRWEYVGAGGGFGWATKYVDFTVNAGVSNAWLPFDFNFSITHFF